MTDSPDNSNQPPDRGGLTLFPQTHETIVGVRTGKHDPLPGVLTNFQKWNHINAWVETGITFDARSAESGTLLGGSPIGIKDIIDVEGQPTSLGCDQVATKTAAKDADVVANLKKHGAVIIGKTVTTQFACFDPPSTLNPWDVDRTPGGSSSGSAAAVAAGMCLAAVGTQTGGSIIRPASYCGVCGLKPTFNLVSLNGVAAVSKSLDHVGPIARCVADLGLMLNAMCDRTIFQIEDRIESLPTVGRLGGMFRELAESDVAESTDNALEKLKSAGAKIVEISAPSDFDDVLKIHRTIMVFEAFREHAGSFAIDPYRYKPGMTLLLEEGSKVSESEYRSALEGQKRLTEIMGNCFCDVDVLVTPATTSAAPDLISTGDPAMNSPFSLTGLPTVSIPTQLNHDGLPLAIQFVGRHQQDAGLLTIAQWCEAVLRGTL